MNPTRPTRLAWLVLLTTLWLLPDLHGARAGAAGPGVPGEVLVGLRPEAAAAAAAPETLVAHLAGGLGVVAGYQPAIGAARIRLHPGIALEAALRLLQRRPELRYAEPNGIVHLVAT